MWGPDLQQGSLQIHLLARGCGVSLLVKGQQPTETPEIVTSGGCVSNLSRDHTEFPNSLDKGVILGAGDGEGRVG